MDAIGEHHAKRSKPGSERHRPQVFFYMWTTDPRDKHKPKQTWSYANSYIEHVCNNGATL
jgi:hypothetical protein